MNISSNSPEFSLLQKQAAQRALVAKMRTRLAGGSEFEARIKEKEKITTHKKRFSWGAKIGIAAIVILGNLAYLGVKKESKSDSIAKHALTLPAPSATLSLDDQALYWTYALYDYNLLKTRFGAPKGAVVDARVATAKIKELMPKLDARTRFIINNYRPPSKRNT
jgi:hypothetical protein